MWPFAKAHGVLVLAAYSTMMITTMRMKLRQASSVKILRILMSINRRTYRRVVNMTNMAFTGYNNNNNNGLAATGYKDRDVEDGYDQKTQHRHVGQDDSNIQVCICSNRFILILIMMQY